MNRDLVPAAKWLAAQHSASFDEFRRKHGQMKLDGLVAHGLAQTKDQRVALTRAGLRELQAAAPLKIELED